MSKVTSAQRLKLKNFVKQLENFTGRHTELVSVYVPAGYDMNKIINHLAQEQGTASNIKSKSTRDNVQAALEKMIQHLRLYPRTPPHGLAAFSGNVAEREGQQDYEVFSIEPPVPLNQRLYRCDKKFMLDPLFEMTEDKNVFGLVVMDKREGNIALLKGKTIIPLSQASSAVPGKTRAGGQCLDPDTLVLLADGTEVKINNIQIGDELKAIDLKKKKVITTECLDVWNTEKRQVNIRTSENFITSSRDHLFFVKKDKKIIEVEAKDLIKNDVLINKELKEEVIESVTFDEGKIEMIDIKTEAENFFANNILTHNSAQRFERLREGAAKDFLKKIGEMMKSEFLENRDLKGIIVGGPGHTKNEFVDGNFITDQVKRKVIGIKDLSYTGDFGLQELLDKSEDLLANEEVMEEKKIMQKFFNLLGKNPDIVAYGKDVVLNHLKNGVVDTVLISETLDDETLELFDNEAEKMGSNIQVISEETREGAQLKDIGRIAAILRYAISS